LSSAKTKVDDLREELPLRKCGNQAEQGIEVKMEPMIGSRRSGRIAKRIPLTLRWQSPGCDFEDYAAETTVLSRHGCKVVCGGRARLGTEIFVLHPERGKSTRARVIYRELIGRTQQIALALEFIGTSNFWQIDFPPPAGAFAMS